VRGRETNDPTDSSSKRAGNGIAVGAGIGRGGRRDELDALGHHLAIERHRISTRNHPIDVVREVWRVIPRSVSPAGGPAWESLRDLVRYSFSAGGMSAGSALDALPFFLALNPSRTRTHEIRTGFLSNFRSDAGLHLARDREWPGGSL
jgi:hypothetical protein